MDLIKKLFNCPFPKLHNTFSNEEGNTPAESIVSKHSKSVHNNANNENCNMNKLDNNSTELFDENILSGTVSNEYDESFYSENENISGDNEVNLDVDFDEELKHYKIEKLINVTNTRTTYAEYEHNNRNYFINIKKVIDKQNKFFKNDKAEPNSMNELFGITITKINANTNNSEKYVNDDHTTESIKEFDDILAGMQKDNSVTSTGTYSYSDIEDLLSQENKSEELARENNANTYNLKKIKYSDWINTNTVVNDSNNANNNVGQTLEAVVTKLRKHSVEKEAPQDTDIISISSDDSTINENEQFIEAIEMNEVSDEIENIETISVSSDDENENGSESGYNSSDFQFITEEEAKKDGFITNSNSEKHSPAKNLQNDLSVAGPSNNVDKFHFYKKESKVIADKSYLENYAIPQGDTYFKLFEGTIPGLPHCEIHFLETKSLRARAPMLVQYNGVGFDMNLVMYGVDNTDYKSTDRKEARESLKKILQMYPDENTKPKRRRRF